MLQLDYAPTEAEKEHAFTSNFLVTQPRIKKLVVETDNPLVSPLFNKDARKKLMMSAGRDSKQDDLMDTPYKAKTKIPPPNFNDADSQVVSSFPTPSSPHPIESQLRPTPIKKPMTHASYIDAFYDTVEPTPGSVNNEVPLPRCTRTGVYTIPAFSSLQKMAEKELMSVSNFTVKKDGVGSVQFQTPVDVRALDIDSIIEFAPQAITVYPDETVKPPVGRGLNTRAIITLENCYPTDPRTNRHTKEPSAIEQFTRRLRRKCTRYNSKFLSYDNKNGEWTFEVEGF